MTREEAIEQLQDAKDGYKEYLSNEALEMAIKALEQEPTTKNEAKYCDRNICLKNEYNNIGCEDCEVTKSQVPTTKNDLGVDKLISDCEKMSFDMEIFNKPLKVVALDAVKNIVKDLSLVTPQEPRWIPVSERLPKIAYVYRVTRYYPNNVMNPKYLVDACAFDGSNTWYNDNRINHERAYADNIIAWQENPEPYEPQESEEV